MTLQRITLTLAACLLPLLFIGCESGGSSGPEPNAGFTFSVDGRTVTFTTTAELRDEARVAWDYGDGLTGNGFSSRHTYATPGTYVVVQTITDDNGTSSSDANVMIEDPPICRFSFVGAGGLCVQFVNDSDNWDPTSPGHLAHWTFGDSNDSSDDEPLHCYGASGSYTAALFVENTAGSDECQARVTVSEGIAVSGVSSR